MATTQGMEVAEEAGTAVTEVVAVGTVAHRVLATAGQLTFRHKTRLSSALRFVLGCVGV